jgi:hypothetical protein
MGGGMSWKPQIWQFNFVFNTQLTKERKCNPCGPRQHPPLENLNGIHPFPCSTSSQINNRCAVQFAEFGRLSLCKWLSKHVLDTTDNTHNVPSRKMSLVVSKNYQWSVCYHRGVLVHGKTFRRPRPRLWPHPVFSFKVQDKKFKGQVL